MKIIIEREELTITFDLESCRHAKLVREAFEMALAVDGYTKELIENVFNISVDAIPESDTSQRTLMDIDVATGFEKWDAEAVAKSGQKAYDRTLVDTETVAKKFDLTAKDEPHIKYMMGTNDIDGVGASLNRKVVERIPVNENLDKKL